MLTIVFQKRFGNELVSFDVMPTLESGTGTGGTMAPRVMYWEEEDECLDAHGCADTETES